MTIKEAQEAVDKWIKEYGVRYFSELTTLMRTDRIEISQQNYIPLLICLLHIH